MSRIGVAMIGCGGVALSNHLPGLKFCDGAQLVALCDSDAAILDRASRQTGVNRVFTKYEELLDMAEVHAVIIATPNIVHTPIALAAVARGKHVLCEKPIAMCHADAVTMWRAAEKAGVRHMTAFTYRFVPAMRYMAHLVARGDIGTPYHFRAQRFQDWWDRPLGWRQVAKLAHTGELGDMLSHRVDYGHLLLGPITRLIAHMKIFLPTRQGQPADVDDWVAMLCDFANGATGVLESSKLTSGRGEGPKGRDCCEVNGGDGSLVFYQARPFEIQVGKRGQAGLQIVPVPREFLTVPGTRRDPHEGDPLITFRYDQNFEFIDAIRNQRPCAPSFKDGARAQAVIDACVASSKEQKWVQLPQE